MGELVRLPAQRAFDGSTYEPGRDFVRLNQQQQDVWNVMKDGRWRSLSDLEAATGHPEASCSARLRDFRKPKYGAHTVKRRYEGVGLCATASFQGSRNHELVC